MHREYDRYILERIKTHILTRLHSHSRSKKITVSDFSISNSRVFQVGGHLANTVMFCEFINNTTITVCTDQAHVAAHGRKPLLMYSARLSDCLQMLNLHRITNNITNANCVSNPTTSTKQNLQH